MEAGKRGTGLRLLLQAFERPIITFGHYLAERMASLRTCMEWDRLVNVRIAGPTALGLIASYISLFMTQ